MSLKDFDNRNIVLKNKWLELSFWTENDRDYYRLGFKKVNFYFQVHEQPKLDIRYCFEPGLYFIAIELMWFSFSILINL
ncbi:hypothetical protein [Cyanothece sp. BG0011]|uniref:hypothetical protein n=1 Tax=Cyanothece sp. BG0011 TaxID=2082950 RepID=UPI000D1FC236|nr:hypothetical protein [Cyanothece sp. BG0011]